MQIIVIAIRKGGKDLLVNIGHPLGCRYYIGEWRNEQFYPESHAMMNWPGGRFFANDSFLDDRGRRILIAWVGEALLREGKEEKGWAGVMSMPRVLTLAEDGIPRFEPIEEIERLRINARFRSEIPGFPEGLWSHYGLWQLSSEFKQRIQIPGTDSDIDVSVFPGTREELRKTGRSAIRESLRLIEIMATP